jgi:hypothetical protein
MTDSHPPMTHANKALIEPPPPIGGDATWWHHRVADDHDE